MTREEIENLITQLMPYAEAGSTTTVMLCIKRPPPSGDYVRLDGRRGPLGYVLCVNSQGETVARFETKKVIDFLSGLIKDA